MFPSKFAHFGWLQGLAFATCMLFWYSLGPAPLREMIKMMLPTEKGFFVAEKGHTLVTYILGFAW